MPSDNDRLLMMSKIVGCSVSMARARLEHGSSMAKTREDV